MRRSRLAAVCMGGTLVVCAAMAVMPHLAMSTLPTEEVARVRLAQVAQGRIEQVLPVTGHVRGVQEFAALAPESGIVCQVYAREGDRVSAGAPLFRMDAALAEETLRQTLTAQAGAERLAASADAMQILDQSQQAAAENALDAQLSAASEAIKRCTVRAQGDGVVVQIAASELSAVAAGTPVVLLRSEEEAVQCSVVARDAAKVRPGMPVRISLCGELLSDGKVTAVSPTFVDQITGQTVCQVTTAPAKPLDLPLGASVDVEVVLFEQDQVPVLPVSAITKEGTVWWAAGGRGYEIPVTVVVQDEVNCWVTLPEGTSVVDGSAELVPGQRLREEWP